MQGRAPIDNKTFPGEAAVDVVNEAGGPGGALLDLDQLVGVVMRIIERDASRRFGSAIAERIIGKGFSRSGLGHRR